MNLVNLIAETIFEAKERGVLRHSKSCLTVLLTPQGWADAEKEFAGMHLTHISYPNATAVQANMCCLLLYGIQCHLIEAAVPKTLIFIGELAPEIKSEPVTA